MSLYHRHVYAPAFSVVTGFTFRCRLTRPDRLIRGSCSSVHRSRLGLPPDPASRRRPCLRLGVSTTSSPRGLPPPINRPCWAHNEGAVPPKGGTAPFVYRVRPPRSRSAGR